MTTSTDVILRLLAEYGEMSGLDLVRKSEGRLGRGTVYVWLNRLQESGQIAVRRVPLQGPVDKCMYRIPERAHRAGGCSTASTACPRCGSPTGVGTAGVCSDPWHLPSAEGDLSAPTSTDDLLRWGKSMTGDMSRMLNISEDTLNLLLRRAERAGDRARYVECRDGPRLREDQHERLAELKVALANSQRKLDAAIAHFRHAQRVLAEQGIAFPDITDQRGAVTLNSPAPNVEAADA